MVSVLDNGRGFDIRQKGKKRTGLGIITQTLAVVNEHNRHKMTFALQNRKAEDDSVAGCMHTRWLRDIAGLAKFEYKQYNKVYESCNHRRR